MEAISETDREMNWDITEEVRLHKKMNRGQCNLIIHTVYQKQQSIKETRVVPQEYMQLLYYIEGILVRHTCKLKTKLGLNQRQLHVA